jgi:hypothetical protein
MADLPVPLQSLRPLQGEVMTDRPPSTQTSLSVLDELSRIMDRLFVLPGTRVRFGLNSLLLLVPVLGDLLPSFISACILVVGLTHHRVPRIVAARMVLNSLLDAGLGWIPVIGDLFDLYFKADTRNVRLLQQYAEPSESERTGTWRHWGFVLAILAAVMLVMVLILAGAAGLLWWGYRVLQGG